MTKYKLFIQESEIGYMPDPVTGEIVRIPYHYYVRASSRNMVVFGPQYATVEEAFEQLRKCEQDDEYAFWQQDQKGKPMRNMSKYEKLVLIHLYEALQTDSNVFTFQGLADELGITVRQAKTACRALKRRGYAEHEAYWNEDGVIGGSGYCIAVDACHMARLLAEQATSQTSDSPATAEPVPSSAL